MRERKKESSPLTEAFFKAMEAGSDCVGVGMAKVYIDGGHDLRVKNESGKTPLFFAIDHRQVAIVRLLLERDPTLANETRKTIEGEESPLDRINRAINAPDAIRTIQGHMSEDTMRRMGLFFSGEESEAETRKMQEIKTLLEKAIAKTDDRPSTCVCQ